MKKFILTLALCLAAFSVSAQGWALGGRITGGVQVQAEYQFASENYLEGRLGLGLLGGAGLDFTALYQWNIKTMDWTPKAGEWFFDAGVGASLGTGGDGLYLGATGCAKLGIEFSGAPVKLALDYSPTLGPYFGNGGGFRTSGFWNFGLSCVYCF